MRRRPTPVAASGAVTIPTSEARTSQRRADLVHLGQVGGRDDGQHPLLAL